MASQEDAVDVDDLRTALESAWNKSTSVDSDWNPTTPSRGQCAVTALVVQDEYGGSLLRSVVEGVSHYWNRLPDGREIDLTRDQFHAFEPDKIVERERGYVLSFPDTEKRYMLLRERLDRQVRPKSLSARHRS